MKSNLELPIKVSSVDVFASSMVVLSNGRMPAIVFTISFTLTVCRMVERSSKKRLSFQVS